MTYFRQNWTAPTIRIMGCRPTYTVRRRTSVFRLVWKVTAPEKPSNVENRSRVRTQVQTAATHIFEYVW